MPKVPDINYFILLFHKHQITPMCKCFSCHISSRNVVNNCATLDTISCIIVPQQWSAHLFMRGKVSIAAISACHFIEAEDFNGSRAVNSQLTVLQWDCGAGGSSDYRSRPSAAGFPVQLPHKAFSVIFLSLLPRLSSISGWLWATYCWCVFLFIFFFFLHIFTDSSHKAPNCSRPRGETRQVLSITSFLRWPPVLWLTSTLS